MCRGMGRCGWHRHRFIPTTTQPHGHIKQANGDKCETYLNIHIKIKKSKNKTYKILAACDVTAVIKHET